ncbi:ABC-2 family transporter [Krasilnikovia cinnamomea]|uniref:ABC-2 family transporter n=1 Tax=Krasilnikovia cinnamomea TaxID=349313 RepID=A0A4V2G6U0_9ACTN|nr:ABC transporter permease [Krasilnikovia cinnamomea]RZU50026.1 ABC-2 family transporter [Krasilnikovia cinnamomea]
MKLVNAELLKIRTTPTWWIFGLILLPLYAASILLNWGSSVAITTAETGGDVPANQAEQIQAAGETVNVAANLYTSGQFMGVLMVLLLGAILVTNEFFHQTATTTFLVTPRRESVVLAKYAAAALLALVFWLVLTVLNLIFAPLILHSLDLGPQLGDPAVWRAIGLNGLAFGLWAVLGVGAGVLIRSQIAATVVLTAVYVVGSQAVGIIFFLLSEYVADWFSKLQVIFPTAASQLMISGTDLPGSPPRWVGAAVLIGYAVVMGLIGTAIIKRRDVS